jgi:hypothetical protein
MWRKIFSGRHSRCGNCTKQIALRQTKEPGSFDAAGFILLRVKIADQPQLVIVVVLQVSRFS